MDTVNKILTVFNFVFATVACIGVFYSIKKDSRDLATMDQETFSKKVMQVIKSSDLVDEVTTVAKQQFDISFRDKLVVEFQHLVTKPEFNEVLRRVENIEKQTTLLVQNTAGITGRIDTILQFITNK